MFYYYFTDESLLIKINEDNKKKYNRINNLQLKNFEMINMYDIPHYNVNFNEDCSIMIGPNGIGKTIMMNYISFCFSFLEELKHFSIKDNKELAFSVDNNDGNSFGQKFKNISLKLTCFDKNNKDRYIVFEIKQSEDKMHRSLFIRLFNLLNNENYSTEEYSYYYDYLSKKYVFSNTNRNQEIIDYIRNVQLPFITYIKSSRVNNFILSNIITNICSELDRNGMIEQTIANSIIEGVKPTGKMNILYSKIMNKIKVNELDSIKKKAYYQKEPTDLTNILNSPNVLKYINSAFHININRVGLFTNDNKEEHLFLEEKKGITRAYICKDIDNLLAFIARYLTFMSITEKTVLQYKNWRLDYVFDMETFYMINEQNDKIPLSCLSSGEINYIEMIFDLCFSDYRAELENYINFNKDFPVHEGRIARLFLIDEPEISLHIEWQEKIMECISNLYEMNSYSQFILTTHSPFVSNGYEEYITKPCFLLKDIQTYDN